MGRNVFANHSSSSNDREVADFHSPKNGRVGINAHIVAKANGREPRKVRNNRCAILRQLLCNYDNPWAY